MFGNRAIFIAFVICATSYYIYASINVVKTPSPVVYTDAGKIRGYESTSRDGNPYFTFLGIRYAKAPVGELRYESPEPVESWEDVFDAYDYGPECAQVDLILRSIGPTGDEDCLFLNIFTPLVEMVDEAAETHKKHSAPTMVFIHGGGFVSGSALAYGGEYFLDEKVVVVTINYRLGSLGFLNTGDGVVRGNMGLKDQIFALKWVQKNIEKFGGDPKRVTIFGESAGAMSVHHHTISPMSKGLFQAAISQSGTAMGPFALSISNVVDQSNRHAKMVKCPTENSKAMISCLKKLPVNELLEAHREITELFKDPITQFGPTIEITNDSDTFYSEHPYDIITKGKASLVPWMTGINSHEGLISAVSIVNDKNAARQLEESFSENIANFILYSKTGTYLDDMEKIRNFYFGRGESVDPVEKFLNYSYLSTDAVFAHPMSNNIRLVSKFASPAVYPYYYTYKGGFTLTNIILALKGDYPPMVELLYSFASAWFDEHVLGNTPVHYGPCHADELALLFKFNTMPFGIEKSSKDYEMSKKLVKLWVNFAQLKHTEKYLNFNGMTWKPMDKNSKEPVQYLKLDTEIELINEPNQVRLEFWKALLKTER